MAYRVKAPLVVAKTKNGSYVHVYEGGFLPDDPDPEQLEQLLADDVVEEAEDGPPAPSASKAKWTAYALASGRTEEELADLSRDDIRDLFAE